MFYDLCLPDAEVVVSRQRMATFLSLGFDVAASSHAVSDQVSNLDRSTFHPLQQSDLKTAGAITRTLLRFRECCSLPSSNTAADALPCLQLSRLVVSASDPLQTDAWHAVAKTYDVVAVQPKTERVMQQACTSVDCDIISLDMTQRLPFRLRPQHLSNAVRRGIYFEIQYAGALRDQVSRRNLFSSAQSLTRLLHGRNLILSSGARNALELRGPYDIINMACLLGITKQQAREAISSNCEAVLAHGAVRKMHAGMLLVSRIPGASEEEQQPQGAQAATAQEGAQQAQAGAPTALKARRSSGASKRKRAAS